MAQSETTSAERTAEASEPTAAEREYGLRLGSWKTRREDLQSTDRLFGRIRLATFLLIIAVSCAVFADATLSAFWILIPIAAFIAALRFHAPVLKRLKTAEAAHRYYTNCLARLGGQWRTFKQTGAEFSVAQHPWADDLDVFGQGSLFQKMNQCRTLPGQRRLAEWLTSVADAETVALRQRQTESLREQLDLRERLAGIDEDIDWRAAEDSLNGWLQEDAQPFPSKLLFLARLLGVVMAAALILVATGHLRPSVILLLMLLQGPMYYLCRDRIRGVMDQVDAIEKPLHQLSDITAQLETYPFTEKSLQQLQNMLTVRGTSASAHIGELSGRIRWLNNALRNQFFMPLAWAFGLFLHLPHRVERWRAHFGARIPEWLEAVTTLEVVSSIATFNYENEHYCVPVVSPDTVEFSAVELGHPLLPAAECVRNDVSVTRDRPLLLISGSNMSGKSTLLRAIGTNLVLTFCGARVNAQSLRAYPLQIATAMRISDSLQEGRSLFFSVVQRLKTVVDLTQRDRPVLFLLDEILSGTNSHDRRRGAEAVIRTLVSRGALGLVTTHDLTLTSIVDSFDGKAANKHFEDQIDDGHMSFDYLLRDGVVERSNAIELMRMMGLDV